MTVAAACGWSLARSLVVAFAAWPVCKAQRAWLRGLPRGPRRIAWCLVVLPFLIPELWIGYAYSGFALWGASLGLWEVLPAGIVPSSPQGILARNAALDEVLFDLLLFFRAVPVGTLAAYFAPPPPLSAEAVHCFRLAAQRTGARRRATVLALLYNRFHAALPAVALMFLLAFQEFELPSLMGRPAWTVWLFDSQVGGLALVESLRKALLPVACQLVVLVPLAALVLNERSLPSAVRWGAAPVSRARGVASLGFAVLAGLIVGGVPFLFVGRDVFQGMLFLFRSAAQLRTLVREVLIGTGYALAAATIGTLLAAGLLEMGRTSRTGRLVLALAVLPGLCGSLILGLALIRLLQQPVLHAFYKTPFSFTTGLVLFLLPRALLLRLALWSSRPAEGAYLASLLRQSPARGVRGRAGELAWQMRWRSEYWGLALLAYWGFLDLTIAYLLAPVTIVSTPVMLYNQMHFGKNAALAARVCLAVLLPALCFLLISAGRRPLFRWLWR